MSTLTNGKFITGVVVGVVGLMAVQHLMMRKAAKKAA